MAHSRGRRLTATNSVTHAQVAPAVRWGMSVSGLCSVCEDAPADNQCTRCGSLVCREHFEEDSGCCIDCARGVGRGLRDDVFEY